MKKLTFIIALALLYGCQGTAPKGEQTTTHPTSEYSEKVALLFEAEADTTAHAWYLSDPARRVVQPIYCVGDKRFNHLVPLDSLTDFMAAHPKAALVWSGVYNEVRDSIRNVANIKFIRRTKQPE